MEKRKAHAKSARHDFSAEDRIIDLRFATLQSSSLYRLPSKRQTHVTLDPRFAHVLRDEQFSSKARVDRYGRSLRPKGSRGKGELKRLYTVEGESGEEEEEEERSGDNDELIRRELAIAGGKAYDPAREGGFSESSSSEEDSIDESESDEGVTDEEEPEFGVIQDSSTNAPAGQVTRKLAVVNLDWDNIRAVDLLAVFSSFAHGQSGLGSIETVAIYPSEFGKERMQREDIEGPPKELFVSRAKRKQEHEEEHESESEEDGEDEDEDERIRKSILKEDMGEEYSSAHLRRYQMERLRYYYAVLTCSTPSLAHHIYQNVDGTEYLSSANFFDLRFVPDDMVFSDSPRDECDAIPEKYRPNEFITDALQHSKVKLTWDADDQRRKEAQKKAFSGSRKEINQNDLQAYLGSGSSSEDEDYTDDRNESVEIVDATNAFIASNDDHTANQTSNPKPILGSKVSRKEAERQRMRSLLGLPTEPTQQSKTKRTNGLVGDMQITFTSGLSNPKDGSMFENKPLSGQDETTVEKYIREEKERKAKRREKVKAARNAEPEKQEEVEVDEEQEELTSKEDKEDLGFDDPFFTQAPDEARASAQKQRKVDRKRKRAEREAEEAARIAETEELRRLIMPDSAVSINGSENKSQSQYFPLSQLTKAQKALQKQNAKGKKKRKLTQSEKAALEVQKEDRFDMDVSDPRFSAIFERSEYALDPSHPKFKGTEGMKKLVEEGRRRREVEREEEDWEGFR